MNESPSENRFALDQDNGVLIDYSTASQIVSVIRNSEHRTINYKKWSDQAKANLIQTIVIHESIYYDSIFDNPVRGDWLHGSYDHHPSPHLLLPADEWSSPIKEALGFKPLVVDDETREDIRNFVYDSPNLLDKSNLLETSKSDVLNFHEIILMSESTLRYLRGNPLNRLLFYLGLQEKTGLTLRLDPTKSQMLTKLECELFNAEFYKSCAESILAELERKRNEYAEASTIILPPVVEHVMLISEDKGWSILDAIRFVRESQHACEFRQLCSKMNQAKRSWKKTNELIEIKKDIAESVNKWIMDFDDGIKYKRRILKLEELPLIGKLLKGTSLNEVTIKDPFLTKPEIRDGLAFINDLLRPI